jgi:hypothetical protein
MADQRGSARTRAAAPILAGLTGLAALAALALLACSPTPSPAPTATPFQTIASTLEPSAIATVAPPTGVATAAPSAISAATACTAPDLKASHDLVEGAAGSRLTTVVLVAQSVCSIDLYPAMGVRDVNGAELVGSTATGSGRLDLDPDSSYSSSVRFANWCNPEPQFPLSLVIRVGAGEVGVTGSSFPDEGDMPPCNGGGGSVLEATPWEAVAP